MAFRLDVHHYLHCDAPQPDLTEVLARLAKIDASVMGLVLQGDILMGAIDDLKQNMVDLRDLAQQYLDLIISKDAAAAALQTQINDLIAASSLAATEKAQLLADIGAAVIDSQATEDALRAGLPGVPPVGGTPMDVSYADRASFDQAAASYTGPEAVTVDGVEAKAGTLPSLDYFTHSATGEVNTSPPTD